MVAAVILPVESFGDRRSDSICNVEYSKKISLMAGAGLKRSLIYDSQKEKEKEKEINRSRYIQLLKDNI